MCTGRPTNNNNFWNSCYLFFIEAVTINYVNKLLLTYVRSNLLSLFNLPNFVLFTSFIIICRFQIMHFLNMLIFYIYTNLNTVYLSGDYLTSLPSTVFPFFFFDWSFFVALVLSNSVRWYTLPVWVVGSTLVKTSVLFTNKMSGTRGYLNEGDGPWGSRKLILMSSFSVSMTHPNHHSLSYKHVTKPTISSNSKSLSTSFSEMICEMSKFFQNDQMTCLNGLQQYTLSFDGPASSLFTTV